MRWEQLPCYLSYSSWYQSFSYNSASPSDAHCREQNTTTAVFRPSRGCVDQISIVQQSFKTCHADHHTTVLVFVDFKSAFYSVDRATLFHDFHQKDMPEIFLNSLRALHRPICVDILAHGELQCLFEARDDNQ